MSHLNIEFKARTNDLEIMEQKLVQHGARFAGEDHQTDTYFKVAKGRLKLREGNVENALIYYERENIAGKKASHVILYPVPKDRQSLKEMLTTIHGIVIVVSKIRRIYFEENVKIHFDRLEGLGTFIEVEAIDSDGKMNNKILEEQCDFYKAFFNIEDADLQELSYSDMLGDKTFS